MAEREYKDSEGNVVTLDKLVRIEPEWAANIIRWYEGKLDEYEHRAKLHMDRCQHDMERIVALEQQNESLASRLDSAENAMREVVSHLQNSQRGSTHWAGCPDVHPVCKAIDMLVDALPLRDVESTNEETQ